MSCDLHTIIEAFYGRSSGGGSVDPSLLFKVKADENDNFPSYLIDKVSAPLYVDTNVHKLLLAIANSDTILLQVDNGSLKASVALNSITNDHISDTANIAWSKIDKTGSSINDLDDVNIISVSDGDGLVYVGGDWTNIQVATASDLASHRTAIPIDHPDQSVTKEKLALNIDASDIGFIADKVDGRDVDDATISAMTLWSSQKIADYIHSKIAALDWQESVLDKDLTEPPLNPNVGDRYIVAANQPPGTATGDWSGHENEIAEWDGTQWIFILPDEGTTLEVEDEKVTYRYYSSDGLWRKLFAIEGDHEQLLNLYGGAENDHWHLTQSQHDLLVTGVDASSLHHHNSLYYTKTQLQTSGNSEVHWDNITNKPELYYVKVSDNDSSPNYLSIKLVRSYGILLTVLNDGADERLEIKGLPDNQTITFDAVTSGFTLKDGGILDRHVNNSAGIKWYKIDKAGSNLTEIETRNHNDLQNIQGGQSTEYYHLTQNQHSLLVGGVDASSLHHHDSLYYRKVELQTSGQAQVHWDNITNKPATYPPSPHTHTSADITDFVEAAQDAVGSILVDSSTIDFTYDDINNQITATIVLGSITNDHVSDTANISWSKIDKTGSSINDLSDVDTTSIGDNYILLYSLADSKWKSIPQSALQGLIRVDSADTVPDYLTNKLTTTDPIVKTVIDSAGNKSIQLSLAYLTDHFTLDSTGSLRLKDGVITDQLVAINANIAWSKIDKTGSSINDLDDVDTTGANHGQVLMYNATDGKWYPDDVVDTDELVKVTSTDNSSGYLDAKLGVLAALSKTIQTDIDGNQTIQFSVIVDNTTIEVNASNQLHVKDGVFALVGHNHNLSDLVDVDSSNKADGRLIVWNEVLGKHVYVDPSTAADTFKVKTSDTDLKPDYLLNKLLETTTISLQELEVSTIPKIAISVKDGSITNVHIADGANIAWSKIDKTGSLISDLGDVEITNPTSNDALLYDSIDSKWKNIPVATAADLEAHKTAVPLDHPDQSVTKEKLALNIDASDIGFIADKVDGRDVDDTIVSAMVLWSAQKVVDYVDSKIAALDWQESVLDKDLTDPPLNPNVGDRYIVAANQPSGTATGDWAGHENQIAEWDGTQWIFTIPDEGTTVEVEDERVTYRYYATESQWRKLFAIEGDHEQLLNLYGGAENDHWHLTQSQHDLLVTGVDASSLHHHDSLYYKKIELQTSGQAEVHWDNITNKPTTYPPSSHVHTSSDITDFTEAAQDAVGSSLTNTDTIQFNYDDDNNQISAIIVLGSITNDHISDSANIAWSKIDKTGSSINDLDDVDTTNLSDGYLLVYSSSVSKWIVKSSSELPGLVQIDLSDNTAGYLSDKLITLAPIKSEIIGTDNKQLQLTLHYYSPHFELYYDAGEGYDGALKIKAGAITDTEVSDTANIAWSKISKVGSNLTDIEIRNHNDLQNVQGGTTGERYHLTQNEHDLLTNGSDASSLHNHDSLYYKKIELQTSGQAEVHWDNITNKPTTYPPSPHIHTSSDISDFTEAAQDAVGSSLTDSHTVQFTYDDNNNQISASVKLNSLTNDHVSDTANIAWSKIDKAGSSIDDLSDVEVIDPVDGQVLVYSGGRFTNQTISTPSINPSISKVYFECTSNDVVPSPEHAEWHTLLDGFSYLDIPLFTNQRYKVKNVPAVIDYGTLLDNHWYTVNLVPDPTNTLYCMPVLTILVKVYSVTEVSSLVYDVVLANHVDGSILTASDLGWAEDRYSVNNGYYVVLSGPSRGVKGKIISNSTTGNATIRLSGDLSSSLTTTSFWIAISPIGYPVFKLCGGVKRLTDSFMRYVQSDRGTLYLDRITLWSGRAISYTVIDPTTVICPLAKTMVDVTGVSRIINWICDFSYDGSVAFRRLTNYSDEYASASDIPLNGDKKIYVNTTGDTVTLWVGGWK